VKKFKCSLCGEESVGFGNNPEPLAPYKQRCCDDCNWTRVVPARLSIVYAPSANKRRKMIEEFGRALGYAVAPRKEGVRWRSSNR